MLVTTKNVMSQELARIDKSIPQPQPSRGLCVHEMFELQASRTPGATAVNCGEQKLSYSELDQRANHIAEHLRANGIGPEVPVVLYFERCVDMVVAIIGVLKAGGAYVPVDLAYPSERFSFMLEDSKAPVLLTQQKLRDRIPRTSALVLSIEEIEHAPGVPADRQPNLRSNRQAATKSQAQNAAYVIYTSGSTGIPKGVLVTHHNVVRLLTQTQNWYGFDSNDVWQLFHSYAFDVSVWELWGALFYGGRIVIVPHLVSRSPHEFYELLSREKVTVLNQTPSAFRRLIWA